jgi:hypothetical protein
MTGQSKRIKGTTGCGGGGGGDGVQRFGHKLFAVHVQQNAVEGVRDVDALLYVAEVAAGTTG